MSSLIKAKEGTDAEVAEVAGEVWDIGGREPLGSSK